MSDLLSSTSRPTNRAPVPTLTALAIGVAAILIAGVGSVFAVGQAIGGGQQPEDVLPASAIAVVKVDLAPSLGQRKAVYDISRKFSGVHAKSVGSVKDDLLSQLLTDNSQKLDYSRDIKPWLGDRVAVAAVPNGTSFAPVAAVQYTDKDKATKTLKDAEARDSTFAFAFSGDYVIVANTQADADRYAKTDKHLSDNDTYNSAIDSLGGDQIVVGWADVKGVYKALPKDQLRGTPFADITSDPSGSFVVGAHADSGYVEIRGKAVDVGDSLKQYGGSSFGKGRGQNLIGAMPIDATAALELTGLGETLTKTYAALSQQAGFAGIQKSAQQYGLALPDDLKTVFGTDLAAALFGNVAKGDPAVAVHVLTDDPAGAVRILNRVAATGDNPTFVVDTDGGGGYYLGTSAAAITHATNGTLGDSAPFKRALPDAKDAGFALYLSIGRTAGAVFGTRPEFKNLEAFGMTANGETGEFRMRLTFS
ncbi:MAG: hypothetical protein JWP11_224 [Frankiales bacterium]|nr:hypothetical protein [Frankiales bacterium]